MRQLALLVAATAALFAQQQGTAVRTAIPADNATNVPLNARIMLSLPAMAHFAAPFRLSRAGVPVPGRSSLLSSTWFLFRPDQLLQPNTVYEVQFDAPGLATFRSRFTTGSSADNEPPQLAGTEPPNGSLITDLNTPLLLRFNKPVDPESLLNNPLLVRYWDGAFSQSYADLLDDGSTVRVTASDGLALGRGGYVELSTSPPAILRDWVGNRLSSPAPLLTFSTHPRPPADVLRVTGTYPEQGDTGIPTNHTLLVSFNLPLASMPVGTRARLSTGGGSVPVRVTMLDDRRALAVRAASLLLPNRDYTLQVDGLLDQLGRPLAEPRTITFRTGTLPDLAEPRYVGALNFSLTLPANAPIRLQFSAPVPPATLGEPAVTIRPRDSNGAFLAADYRMEDGHRTMLVLPRAPVPPGFYFVTVQQRLNPALDRALQYSAGLVRSAAIDTAPPEVTALFPPEGAEVPGRVVPQLVLSEPINPASITGSVRLLQGGTTVPAMVNVQPGLQSLTVQPRSALTPGLAYRLEVEGLRDWAGNELALTAANFSVTAAAPDEPFRLVSIQPERGQLDVEPTSPVVLTFNRPPNPATINTNNLRLFVPPFAGLPVDGTFRLDGAVVTFSPAVPLRAGRYLVNVQGISDLFNQMMPGYGAEFTVRARELDQTRPEVTAVLPGDGEPVSSVSPVILLDFSKPVDIGTVPANVHASAGGQVIAATWLPGANNRRVAVTFSNLPPGRITLSVGSGVRDLTGNPLVPYRTTVLAVPPPPRPAMEASLGPLRRIPGDQGELGADSPISMIFAVPLDRASVESGFLISLNGRPVPGRFQWTADDRTVTFVPAQPLTPGGNLQVWLTTPARTQAGQAVVADLRLRVRDTVQSPSPGLVVTGTNLGGVNLVPANGVIDLEFGEPVPDSFLQPGVAVLRTGTADGPAVGLTIEKLSPVRLRFRPAELLTPDRTHFFTFAAGQVRWPAAFVTGPALVEPLRVVGRAPVNSPGGLALNTRVALLFNNQLSGLSRQVELRPEQGGSPVPAMVIVGQNNLSVSLLPHSLLQPDTLYTATLFGAEDLAGRSLGDVRWSFRTGNLTDLVPPRAVRIDAQGSGDPAGPINITFDEGVSPVWAFENLLLSGPDRPAVTISFSDDQRTVTLTPRVPLGLGVPYRVMGNDPQDFAGNWSRENAVNREFVAGTVTAAPPRVMLTSPPAGAANVPLNAQLQVRFQSQLDPASLDGLVLLEQGERRGARARLESDGRTVSLLPASLLREETGYELVVAGLRSTLGEEMEGEVRMGFRTGQQVDFTAPVPVVPVRQLSQAPAGVPLWVRFAEPLNPLTIGPRTVQLQRSGTEATLATELTVTDSGRSILITPVVPLLPGVLHQIRLSGLTDLAGNPVSDTPTFGGFQLTSATDQEPPVLRLLAPADGAANLPLNARIGFDFNEPVDFTRGDECVRLTRNGVPVPVTVRYGLLPNLPNVPGYIVVPRDVQPGEYELRIEGVTDVAGNPAAPVTTRFTLGSSMDFTPLTVVSTQPGRGSAGVPPTADIVVTYNKPLHPSSADTWTVTSRNTRLPGRVVVTGNRVQFVPAVPLPVGSTIELQGNGADLAGNLSVTLFLSFTTAGEPDRVPPVLESVFPENGSEIQSEQQYFLLRLSEPVLLDQGTVPARFVTGTGFVADNVLLLMEDGRTLQGVGSFGPNQEVTLNILPGLVDFGGNPLAPFRVAWRTGPQPVREATRVLSAVPAAGTAGVPRDAVIELRFSLPVDAVRTRQALRISSNGTAVPGAVEFAEDGRLLRFRPDAPLAGGSTVWVVLTAAAMDTRGGLLQPYLSAFTVAGEPGSTPAPVSLLAGPQAIEVRFNGTVPTDDSAVLLRQGMVPLAFRLERHGQLLRLLPLQPLQPHALYHLTIDGHDLAVRPWTELPVQPDLARLREVCPEVAADYQLGLDLSGASGFRLFPDRPSTAGCLWPAPRPGERRP